MGEHVTDAATLDAGQPTSINSKVKPTSMRLQFAIAAKRHLEICFRPGNIDLVILASMTYSSHSQIAKMKIKLFRLAPSLNRNR